MLIIEPRNSRNSGGHVADVRALPGAEQRAGASTPRARRRGGSAPSSRGRGGRSLSSVGLVEEADRVLLAQGEEGPLPLGRRAAPELESDRSISSSVRVCCGCMPANLDRTVKSRPALRRRPRTPRRVMPIPASSSRKGTGSAMDASPAAPAGSRPATAQRSRQRGHRAGGDRRPVEGAVAPRPRCGRPRGPAPRRARRRRGPRGAGLPQHRQVGR